MSWSHTSRGRKSRATSQFTQQQAAAAKKKNEKFAAVPAKYKPRNSRVQTYDFGWTDSADPKSTFLTGLEGGGWSDSKNKKKQLLRPTTAAHVRKPGGNSSSPFFSSSSSSRRRPQSAAVGRKVAVYQDADELSDEAEAETEARFKVVDTHAMLKKTRHSRPMTANGRRMVGLAQRTRHATAAARTSTAHASRKVNSIVQQSIELSHKETSLVRKDLPRNKQKYGHFPYRQIHFTDYTFDRGLIQFAQLLFRKRCLDLRVVPTLDKEERFVFFLMQKITLAKGPNAYEDEDTTEQGGQGEQVKEGTLVGLTGQGGVTEDAPNESISERELGLSKFDVSSCQLGIQGLQCCCDFLSGTGAKFKFTHLCFNDNQLRNDGAKLLSTQLLTNNTDVVSLDLRACSMGAEGFGALFRALQTTPNLTYLNTSSIQCSGAMTIGVNGSSLFGKFLSTHESLTALHVVNCNLNTPRFRRVVTGLQESKCLVHLDLSSNSLGTKCVLELSGSLRDLTCLETLSLADNDIGDYSVSFLAKELALCENLVTLNLSKNHISSTGLSLITAALPTMLSLQKLMLDENIFGDNPRSGWETGSVQGHRQRLEHLFNARLEAGLPHKVYVHPTMVNPETCALRTLTMNKAELSDTILEQLVEQLKRCKSLKRLELSWNSHVTDAGVEVLAAWTAHESCPLTHLHLDDNRLTDEGGHTFARSLCMNRNLQLKYLKLNNTEVGDSTGKFLLAAMSQNSELHVCLENTHIPFDRLVRVRAASRQNKSVFDSRAIERHVVEIQRLRVREAITREAENDAVQSQANLAELQQLLEECTRAKEQEKWAADDVRENRTLKEHLAEVSRLRGQLDMEVFEAEREGERYAREAKQDLTTTEREFEASRRKTAALQRRLNDAKANSYVVTSALSEELEEYTAMLDKNTRDHDADRAIVGQEVEKIAQFQSRLQREIKMKQLDDKYRASSVMPKKKKKSSSKKKKAQADSVLGSGSRDVRKKKNKARPRSAIGSKSKAVVNGFDPNETDEQRIARKIQEMMNQSAEAERKKGTPRGRNRSLLKQTASSGSKSGSRRRQSLAKKNRRATLAPALHNPSQSLTQSKRLTAPMPLRVSFNESKNESTSIPARGGRPSSAMGQRQHPTLPSTSETSTHQESPSPQSLQKRGSAANKRGMLWHTDIHL